MRTSRMSKAAAWAAVSARFRGVKGWPVSSSTGVRRASAMAWRVERRSRLRSPRSMRDRWALDRPVAAASAPRLMPWRTRMERTRVPIMEESLITSEPLTTYSCRPAPDGRGRHGRSLAAAGSCQREYEAAPPSIRRQINQGFFRKLVIGPGGEVERVEMTEPFAALLGEGQVLTLDDTPQASQIDPNARPEDGRAEATVK